MCPSLPRLARTGMVAALLTIPPAAPAQMPRRLTPADLFAIVQTGAAAWSPDGGAVVVELLESARRLDWNVPTADLRLLDVATGRWRTIARRGGRHLGFFGAAWSPDGGRLAFFSVDSSAVVRPWVWVRGAASPRVLRGIQMNDALADDPAASWSDDAHLVLLARDSTLPNAGELYAEIFAYRNAADRWRTAYDGTRASVATMQSGGRDSVVARTRVLSVDVRTNAITTLATGDLHHPSLSRDRRVVTYWTPRPRFAASLDTSLFGGAPSDADYLRADWGDERRAVDLATHREVPVPVDSPATRRTVPAVARAAGLRGDATLKSTSPTGSAALYQSTSDRDGTRLWLVRADSSVAEVWAGNGWVRDVGRGSAERIAYRDSTGRALTGWVLYPPDRSPGVALPAVTVVYPGQTYGDREPGELSLLYRFYESPQALAALGYAVVLPSIPYPDAPMQGDMIAPLAAAVVPLIDTLVRRGTIDPARVALLGQSAGGYAVQGLVTRTDRFRTAISTAGYSNLVSLYGTFYGQFRHGDAGDPQLSTVLRFMQFERGYYRAEAPPAAAALETYVRNSAVFDAARVRTPILLVQGENDFIPVQQSEEMFSALYRRNKRAELVRYYGEGHTVTRRANVLDFWRRIEAWLRETMPAR